MPHRGTLFFLSAFNNQIPMLMTTFTDKNKNSNTATSFINHDVINDNVPVL